MSDDFLEKNPKKHAAMQHWQCNCSMRTTVFLDLIQNQKARSGLTMATMQVIYAGLARAARARPGSDAARAYSAIRIGHICSTT